MDAAAQERPINEHERDSSLPAWAQTKLFFLRQELHFAQLKLQTNKATIKQLRHEVRLRDRVMRLKNEAVLSVATHDGLSPRTLRALERYDHLAAGTPEAGNAE